MTDVLLKKKKILNIVGAFVAAGAVLFYGTVPVFASAQSVGSIDYDTLTTQECVAHISMPYASYVVSDGAYQLKVPIYLRFYNPIPLGDNWTYMSGMIRYNTAPTAFVINTNNVPVNISAAYFESVDNDNIRVAWNTSAGLRIYLDNYRILGNTAAETINLGYMVYNFQQPASTFTLNFSTSSVNNQTPTVAQIRLTAYEYGFAEAIAYGISQSSSMVEVNEWLANISQDTSYLPSIVSSLNQNFPLILSALTQINNNVYAIYQQLLSMNAAQSSEAAAIEGEVNQKASQSAVLSDDMAVNKPQLSGDDINISGLIDSSVNQKFTGFLGALVNNQFITTMFLIALSCMIIGFVLYGKK